MMILFTILLLMAFLLVNFVVLAVVGIGGTAAVILFGDVFIFIVIIIFIVKRLINKK